MLTAVIAIFVLMVFVMFVVTVMALIAPVVMRKAMIRVCAAACGRICAAACGRSSNNGRRNRNDQREDAAPARTGHLIPCTREMGTISAVIAQLGRTVT